MAVPTIDCGLCTLRPWRKSDKHSLIRHANNRNVSRNLEDVFPYPYTDADADAWLSRQDGLSPWRFAIAVEGEPVGGIGLDVRGDIQRHSAMIGYWLGEAYWGRGIMTRAVGALTERALAAPDLYRVYAFVFAWNKASMRVLEKAGYQREGILIRSGVKDGVLFDQVLYAITRDPGLPYEPAM